MSQDKEVLLKVWEGRIPVCFRLAPNEWRSADPEEIYVSRLLFIRSLRLFKNDHDNRKLIVRKKKIYKICFV